MVPTERVGAMVARRNGLIWLNRMYRWPGILISVASPCPALTNVTWNSAILSPFLAALAAALVQCSRLRDGADRVGGNGQKPRSLASGAASARDRRRRPPPRERESSINGSIPTAHSELC